MYGVKGRKEGSKKLAQCYCELPGQEIDFNKLEICFGPNIPSYLNEEAAGSHGVQLVESHGK